LFAIVSTSLLSAQDNGYDIRIRIKGLHKDTVCYLANEYGEKQFIRDTAKADASGQLVFSKNEKLHGGIYFLVISKRRTFDFLIDQVQKFSMETDTANYIKNMKIKGSEDNKLFYEYMDYIAGKQKEVAPLQAQLKKLTKLTKR
jgi:hypothetical protein